MNYVFKLKKLEVQQNKGKEEKNNEESKSDIKNKKCFRFIWN